MFAQPSHWSLNPSMHMFIIKPCNVNVTPAVLQAPSPGKGFTQGPFSTAYCCDLNCREKLVSHSTEKMHLRSKLCSYRISCWVLPQIQHSAVWESQ